MSDYFGKEVPKLGFGLMRLPKKGLHTDMEQVKHMVDLFMEAGFTYFDTAYVYLGSEAAIKKALVDRYPRESFTLATKLNAMMMAPTEKAAKKQFYTSLERTGAGYFDYYLLHAMMEGGYKKYDKFHLWDFVGEQKAKGLVKHMGFSFHAGPQLLDRLLKEHPEVDFVQLQINYADWENPSVTARANYEVARKHGKSIVVMEPVKGGNLANPPAAVKRLFDEYHPDMSYASWAIRFVASLDGIVTVLSGMSNTQQMEDNLSYMKKFQPLNEAEQKIIQEAQRILGNSSTIPCTACHYCTEGCPKKIPIPEIFSAMNKQLGNGQMEEAVSDYRKATSLAGKASECINCRQCERICPQHLGITGYLKQCVTVLEKQKMDTLPTFPTHTG
ncbi:MAG: aldo/keto reductase [Lachnospiraceae bacterium]|nr:aldo/keto reductase [Lachnospiraceae bacterium]